MCNLRDFYGAASMAARRTLLEAAAADVVEARHRRLLVSSSRPHGTQFDHYYGRCLVKLGAEGVATYERGLQVGGSSFLHVSCALWLARSDTDLVP